MCFGVIYDMCFGVIYTCNFTRCTSFDTHRIHVIMIYLPTFTMKKINHAWISLYIPFVPWIGHGRCLEPFNREVWNLTAIRTLERELDESHHRCGTLAKKQNVLRSETGHEKTTRKGGESGAVE